MKADLYIGNHPPKSIELVASPRCGQLLIVDGQEYPIEKIAHDTDKKKLRLTATPTWKDICDAAAQTASEPINFDILDDSLGMEEDTE